MVGEKYQNHIGVYSKKYQNLFQNNFEKDFLKKNNFDKIVNFKAIFDSESHQQYQNLIQNEVNVLNNCITINILQSLCGQAPTRPYKYINTEMHDIFKR